MADISLNNKRIAKNTFYLYLRMMLLMCINFYTSRIVLQSLGIEDYGVYNAVGGFISMFSMVSASLSTAISRYITYVMGLGDKDRLRKVFSTSVIVQLLLCALLFLLIQGIGVWFLNHKMTIPVGREIAANWVLQFSLVTFVINMLSVPYNAVLIAHERMSAFAYIGILESIATLGIALLLQISPIDMLTFYAFLMCLVALVIRMVYGIYCSNHFEETRGKIVFDKIQLREMLSFAGWNFIGVTSGVLRSQGINILFNIYIGPVVNAARGIAMQVFNAVNKFSGSFYTAVQPQITKSYAAKNYATSNMLACNSCRLAFFLLMLICLPILAETSFLLDIWLITYPEHTIAFIRIIILFCMLEAFSQPLIYLMLATGNIKKYQIVVGTICLLNFPFAWMLVYLGCSPELVQSTTILFSFMALVVRISMLKRMTNLPAKYFWINTFSRSIALLTIVAIIPTAISLLMPPGVLRFCFNVFITEMSAVILIVYLGLKAAERKMIFNKLHSVILSKMK